MADSVPRQDILASLAIPAEIREDAHALIAHTRKNAYIILQESNLGSIQPGKLADLVALDRDYLTVPADQIKDIKPVMTMVGGRIVYESR